MPNVSSITGLPVRRPDGKRAGLVEHVLFSPDEPRVVGYEVERPALAGLIQRKSRFLAFDQARLAEDGRAIVIDTKRIASPSVSAKATGVDWDKTVIWRDQDVRTDAGEMLGRVRDAAYGAQSGKVKKVMLTEGAATDAGLGRRSVAGSEIVGWDGQHVVVSESVAERPTAGGVATAAGIGTAVAKEVVGKAAGTVARGAGKLAGKTIRRAKKSAKEWKQLLSGDE